MEMKNKRSTKYSKAGSKKNASLIIPDVLKSKLQLAKSLNSACSADEKYNFVNARCLCTTCERDSGGLCNFI